MVFAMVMATGGKRFGFAADRFCVARSSGSLSRPFVPLGREKISTWIATVGVVDLLGFPPGAQCLHGVRL